MAFNRRLELLAVVLCYFCVLARADVKLNGFTTSYGLTGCTTPPTEGCGRKGDVCYSDRGSSYAITGTAPVCESCMPKNFRNVATFDDPASLPCALFRAYGCDEVFVSKVWAEAGNNACIMGGQKSYNIENTFSSVSEAEAEFIRQCQQQKSAAFYGLTDEMKITEEKFCYSLRNNMADIHILGEDNKVKSVLSEYKEYYDNKFMK